MSEIFKDSEERAALVDDAAARLGVAPWVVEKDLWVCWTLARICEVKGLPVVTFKGGTSLSKVHGLVRRFSEDIDLTFSRDGWGFVGERDPLQEGLSGKQRSRLVEEIKQRSEATVQELVLPALQEACRETLEPASWNLRIAVDDPQTLLFNFPSPGASYTYGQPVVKVEFGARGEPWPTALRLVKPYLEELYEGVASEGVVAVNTLEPERTFWEKATLLHALYHGTLAKPDKRIERLSRHLYDLYQMWSRADLRGRVLADPQLLQAVVNNKRVFFQEGKAKYEQIQTFSINTVPHDELERRLREDYKAMASMFFPGAEVPTFEGLLEVLREIEAAVARWREEG